jgi:hypothetical protein
MDFLTFDMIEFGDFKDRFLVPYDEGAFSLLEFFRLFLVNFLLSLTVQLFFPPSLIILDWDTLLFVR